MSTRIAQLEQGQRVIAKRVRRLPAIVSAEILRAVSKRTLILIGLGMALGSALGGAGIELVRAGVAQVIRAMGPH